MSFLLGFCRVSQNTLKLYTTIPVLISAMLLSGCEISLKSQVKSRLSEKRSIAWITCPVDVDSRVHCGTVRVPENRQNKSNSRFINLSFALISASAGPSTQDPIAFLTGGPGFSAFSSLKILTGSAINRTRDIVVLEPRGYGYSEPWLGCANISALEKCHADALAAGIDLSQYSTATSVEDYEELRLALEFPRWNLYGVSYGTYWASLYTRMYPNSLRAIIMDSPYPLNAGYDWNRVAALNALERMFNDCRASDPCNVAYPNLRSKFIHKMRRLKANPLLVDGSPFGHIEAFAPIFNALYISTTLPYTPLIIDALIKDDYSRLKKLSRIPAIDIPQGIEPGKISSLGLNATIMCSEDIYFPASPETRVASSAPWPEDIIEMITPEGWDYGRRCKAWPVDKANPTINEPVNSTIPTLVMVGGYDPVTPPEFANAMLLHLTRGTLALNPSTAHAMFADNNPCVNDIMVRFLDNQPENPDVSCLMKTPPVTWKLPER